MPAFVDWITNPENYERLYKPRAISGEKTVDILKKIAEYVNSRESTVWTGDTVKQKISYAKSQYTKAVQLTIRTGEGGGDDEEALQARKREICPFFDRFHAVYSSSLIANPPPPRQSVSYPRERVIVESSPELSASDLEDYFDQTFDDWYQERKAPANKRQKQIKFSPIPTLYLEAYLNDLKAQGAAAHMTMSNSSKQRAWEEQHHEMLAKRRNEHEEMLQQRARELDEVYDRRRRELESDKEAFAVKARIYMAREERLAADIAKYMEKVEAYQNKVEAYQNKVEAYQDKVEALQIERVKLIEENQRLACKLETYVV
ncbi:hypothetical protein BGZ68_003068 [Mortierella alpina]|nr:hypothetical protein BGZ68_003068 [Mortierella alpina]